MLDKKHEDASVDAENADQKPQLEKPDLALLEAKLTAAEKKAEENMNLVLLARADLENFRRRTEKDIANAHKFGLEKLVKELLPVIDSLELSCESFGQEEATSGVHSGIKLTLEMLLKALNKFGVEQIYPQGKDFNPELHQAMSTKAEPQMKDNTVAQVMQKGYLLNNRLLRPALVIVAKNN